jgi:hypothetical protein
VVYIDDEDEGQLSLALAVGFLRPVVEEGCKLKKTILVSKQFMYAEVEHCKDRFFLI